MDLSVVPYGEMGGGRYGECMRNHAAAMGGQAFDGCGEFMPGGDLDALKCAACGCHRNFHRRDDDHLHLRRRPPLLLAPPPHAFSAFLPPPPQPQPFRQIHPQAAAAGREGSETPPRGGEGEARKRSRTKFTAEQKEKMLAFAERVGWRIQRHDDAALDALCGELGINRHVLKVWMHNNKHALAAKPHTQPQAQPEPASAPPIRV